MPIQAPSCFTYKLRTSQKEYRRNPPGTPDVAAIIANKPYWVSSTPMSVDKQKKLVLADWTAPYWDSKKIDRVRVLISELMDQGFIIYTWGYGLVVPMDKNHLSAEHFSTLCKKMTPASPEKVTEAALTQNKLTKSEVQIIDDYWVDHLLSAKKEPGVRIVRTSDLNQLIPKQLYTVLEILNSATPKIEKVIHDVFSIGTNHKARDFRALFKGIKMECDYNHAAVNSAGASVFTDIHDHEFTLSADDLTRLKIVNFNSNASGAYIAAVLRTVLNLEQIELQSGSDLYQLIKLEDSQLEQLHSLNLNSSNISCPNLQLFLTRAPNLNNLNLNSCQSISLYRVKLELKNQILANLATIDLSKSGLSLENLHLLLRASPNLRLLNLTKYDFFDEGFNPGDQTLLSLDTINLNGSNISLKNLQVLLKAAPNLRTITLTGCTNLEGSIELSEQDLGRLETLKLDSSNISLENLQVLLKAAPKLRTINLHACINLKGHLELNEQDLGCLETLRLSRSNLSLENLQTFLEKAPKLNAIDLTRCANLGGVFHFSGKSLASLEAINVSACTLSLENVQTLMKMAPKLKKIDVNNYQGLDVRFNFGDQTFPHLKSICFIELISSIRSMYLENLQILLKRAPNVERLNLLSREGGTLNLEEQSLVNLKEIILRQCLISTENMQVLLKTAPNLTYLGLGAFQILTGRLNFGEYTFNRLETIDLENSGLPIDSVQALLKAAPNVQTLSFKDYENFASTLALSEHSLASLKHLELADSNLSVENLQVLLRAAPNLKTISILGCYNLVGTLKLNEHSLTSLETIDLNNNTSSLEILQALQNAAPLLKASYGQSSAKPINLGHNSKPVNQEHNPKANKEFKPTPSDKPFLFKNNNPSKNQGMIISKLCQYFTLKQQHLEVIAKIQDGICNPLSHYFSNLDKVNWDGFIDLVSAWNGDEANLEQDLIRHFEALSTSIHWYQLTPQPKKQYLGEALNLVLNHNQPYILSNPWHAIALKPAAGGSYYVYDPNYVDGYQEVKPENLLKTIHKTIGTILSGDAYIALYPAKIADPNQFIAEGGLFALYHCDNAADILSQLPQEPYTKDALDGLLFRDVFGMPAWSTGLKSPNPAISQFTQKLLEQFTVLNQDAEQQLVQSLEVLNALQKAECITALVQTSNQSAVKALLTGLISAIRVSANQARYEQSLKTWDKKAELTSDSLTYCHQCLSSTQKKRLIELQSTQQVDSLRMQLEQQAASIHRPVFYIDKPDDLICSAPWIKKNEHNQGVLQKGPGGALYEFLQKNQNNNPLLIVNYEWFNNEDMIRFNGLLDKEPNADGTPLPANTMILGLMNRRKADCYQGSDFYSRFNRTEHCPLTDNQLAALKPSKVVEMVSAPSKDRVIINLYHASNWEDRLLGHWVLSGDHLQFIEGELVKAMKEGKLIELQNGFWGDTFFERFWQQVLTGQIRHAGTVHSIPDNIRFVRPETDVYVWPTIPKIEQGLLIDQRTKVLNPTTLIDFLEPYELVGDKLIKKAGFIAEAKANNNPLVVNVTRSLDEDSWAIILDECNRLGVSLELHCAAGVSLPVAFGHAPSQPFFNENLPKNLTADALIVSSDIDTTISMLTDSNEFVVIDVSECSTADLLVKLDGKLNKETLKFEFNQSNSALITALAEDKKIILKGYCSAELLDSLAPLLQARAHSKANGQLLIITEEEQVGAFFSNRYRHQVSPEQKIAALAEDPNIRAKLASYLDKEPLSRLRARSAYLKANPLANNSDGAWLGLSSLPGSTHASIAGIDKANSAKNCELFTKERIAKVNAALEYAPYVFLTGLSGVGKSTFVEQELAKENDVLYLTEEKIQNWAEDKSAKRKILFLDEANLSPRQWSEFEGLFNIPPTLLINGVLHTLGAEHKVVFAGNPINYGDERTLSPLFSRHGNAVLFSPLPPVVIYEQILKPVCAGMDLAFDPIAERILAVYRFIADCSTTEVLITPRELQMMAQLTITRAKNYPQQAIADVVAHFSYELAKNLVPQAKRADFDQQFKAKDPMPVELPPARNDSSFLLTASRQTLSQQLNDLLALRQWRRDHESLLSRVQKTGGLGGLIIEGEPGIGKSDLVMAALRAQDYKEERDLERPTTLAKPFYKMAVSMAQDEKERLLIKAFNEGAVVLIDEINSSPMMERLLNDLLMGKNPKGKVGDQVRPGFMVIGTQNPVTMAGRRAASTALQRRVITTILPEYRPDEMNTILLAKGVEATEASSMVHAYEKNRRYALNNQVHPVPNFRNLMNVADEYLRLIIRAKEPLLRDIRRLVHSFANKLSTPLANSMLPHVMETVKGEKLELLMSTMQTTVNNERISVAEIKSWFDQNEIEMIQALQEPGLDNCLELYRQFKDQINHCLEQAQPEPAVARTTTPSLVRFFKQQNATERTMIDDFKQDSSSGPRHPPQG
ncbi:MAG: AAA family ATPase [Legionella sp.]|nr:AAA family ATPase [Legionella sp.]